MNFATATRRWWGGGVKRFKQRRFELSKKFLKYGWIALGLLLCLALVIFPACEGEGTTGIPYLNPGVFVQETIGEIDSLDPAWAYDTASGEQIYYMYEGLVGYDGTHTDQFEGLVADSWEAADNSSQITFHLRSGVKFSDGNPVTPEDVEYSFERAMVTDPDGGPIWMLYFPLLDVYSSRDGVTAEDIDNAVQIVDTDSIQFNMVRPYPMQTWLQILCGSWGGIVEKAFCVAHGDWDGDWGTWLDFNDPTHEELHLNDVAMGTGPWALDNWNAPTSITLTRNENYWRGAETVPFDTVITKFVDDWSVRKLDLLAGNADIVYCPRTNIHDLDGVADVNAISGLPDLTVDSFFFNFNITADSPYIGSGALDGLGIPTDFFTDDDVRIGFAEAFDWPTYISQAMQGEATQIASPVVQGLPYYNPDTPKYSYDADDAALHLQAAWGGELWDKGMRFTLIYNTGNLPRKTACEILANDLFAINSKFQISVLAIHWSGTLATIRGRQWAMFQIGWLADYPDPDNFVVPYMSQTGTFSGPASFYDPEVEALIMEGATETDPAVREDIYFQLQQLWYDDLPGIILAQPTGRRFFTKYISGFYFNPIIPGQPGPLLFMDKSES
jgi:peptide/nickel transport system substrate-binding protein